MTVDPALIARRFESVRQRTLALMAPLPWEVLRKQHIPILSPMVWDLGHIGHFEELWLLTELAGEEPLTGGYAEMFDPAANPRPTREALPLPDQPTLYRYLGSVRRRVLGHLGRSNGFAAADDRTAALLRGGFVYELVAEHEEQHQETLLQALQACTTPPYQAAVVRDLPRAQSPPDDRMVHVAGGPFQLGTDRTDFAYDNERPAHEVDLPGFWIDAVPVTNGAYLEFLADGGYRRRELWSDGGRDWLAETAAEAPLYWQRDGDRWLRRRFATSEPPPPREPVVHVTYWEAEAFARWAGKRLPSEAEWEKAALWDPAAGRSRRYPWGDEPPAADRANLDQLGFGVAEAGAYPLGASAYGAEQMVGDVWEWTASDFTAYPGFSAFPYREYSEVFFGDEYKVLRGGSWATRPRVARGTFRNWDYPIRRQIFSGFRCARDD